MTGDVQPLIATINLDSVSVEQAEADGNLIAASPEMLSALRMVVEDAAKYRGHVTPVTLRIVQAAIAKAEASAS